MAIKKDKVLKEAEKLVQKGKVEQAIREYEKVLKAFPDDTTTVNRVGDLYGRIGHVERAIELYEQIAEHFTRDGFTTKAIAIFKKINRLDPQRLDIFARLGELYVDQGLVVEAKNQYRMLADWYMKNDDLDKAIESNQKLVDLEPDDHMAALRLADLLLQQGKVEEALGVYDRLGRMLLEAKKLDEAERLYRHALDQKPPQGEFLAPVCEVFLESGRAAVARELLTAGLKLSPENIVLKALTVRTHLVLGDAKTALVLAREILAEDTGNLELRNLVGGALLETGEAAEAREMLLPVSEELLSKGNFAGAQQAIQKLLTVMPQDQRILNVAVRAYRPSGDEETLFTLSAALAESCFRSDDKDHAKRLYLELSEREPENQLFRKRLAILEGVDPGESQTVDSEAESKDEDLSEEIVLEEDEVDFEEEIEIEPAEAPQEPTVAAEQPIAESEPAIEIKPEVAAEEVSAQPGFDPGERLAEADVFFKYGLVDKAINHLADIVKFFPEEMEARHKLSLLHAEKGEQEVAVELAGPAIVFYRERGQNDKIQELLGAMPELAQKMVSEAETPEEMGADVRVKDEAVFKSEPVEPVIEEVPTAVEVQEVEELPIAALFPEDEASVADSQFVDEGSDLVEVVDAGSDPVKIVDEGSDLVEVVDDEDELEALAQEQQEPIVEEYDVGIGPDISLFELPAEESTDEVAAVVEEDTEDPLIKELMDSVIAKPVAEPVAEELPAPPPIQVDASDELVEISDSISGPSAGDLEQVDFFIEQELFEDAARLLVQLEEANPGHADVRARQLKLKEVGLLVEEVEPVETGSEELFADEEQYIDLAKELEAELAEEEAMVEEATGRGKGEALLEEVFKEFQKGVAEQLSEEDSDTHFNLGIAYREMGLLPEAIREFQVAARDTGYFVESCSMIGVCYQDQGLWSEAAEWYKKALITAELPPDARIALRYDLGVALYGGGDIEQAVEIFEEIEKEEAGYRDVSERLSMLAEHRQAN